MADERLYGSSAYDGGFVSDEAIRFNPRTVSVKKINDNEVLWTFDNCTVSVTAEGSGNERHNFQPKVVMKE